MNKQIKEALALEQQAQQFLSALKNEIGAAIEATDPMPGVQISGTHPIYAVVNLSALHRHSLAPMFIFLRHRRMQSAANLHQSRQYRGFWRHWKI